MYLDAFSISALVDEFMDTLVGGRIQDVIDTDPTGIGLEIYANRQRRYLYMSADKSQPRVHVVDGKLRRGIQKPLQMGWVMRRYVENGILMHVSQPPYERILQFDIEHPEKGESILIIEPMERRSNVLLVHDGKILDCIVRVGPQQNSYRLSLPNHTYEPPPPLTGRLDPATLTPEGVMGIFEQNQNTKQKTMRLLSSRILGMSPLLAKEILHQSGANINQKAVNADPEAIFQAAQQVFAPLLNREWQPGIAEDEDGDIAAYSVYPITHQPAWQPVESLSAAMSAYYGAAIGEEAYTQAKKPVQEALEEAKAKFRAKLASLQSGLKDKSERAFLQQSGELILAYQYNLQPGQTELRAQYDLDAPELVIKLDPAMTPLENAQRYFDKYNRAKRAAGGVPAMIEETEHMLAYLEQLESDLEMAVNWPEIDEVTQALQSRGLLTKKTKVRRLGGSGNTAPLKLTKDGYVIWVGRNSRQNNLVTFKKANSQDLWLHARDVPGAHAVIRYDGRRIPEDLVEQVASIAAFYSKRRNEKAVIVDVTHIKYVKAIKGAGPGMVTYRNERTVTVEPHNEEILNNG